MVRLIQRAGLGALLLTILAAGTAAAAQQSSPGLTVTPDVVYGHKMGMALTYDVIQPETPNGAAVLYMVSGGWVSRWAPPEQLASRSFPGLLEAGFTVIAVRHGSAPRFKVPEAEADVRAALGHVREHAGEWGVDVNRLGVWGGSAGGHLSLMLGLLPDGEIPGADPGASPRSGVAAVVAYYPPVDLRQITGPNERFPALDFPVEQAARISPILYATPDDPPTLFIHGDADTLVGLRSSEIMYAALQEVGVESKLVVIPGGDHGFTNREDRAQAQRLMVDWFTRHLGGR